MPTDLTSYLVKVRHIDAVLRSSNPNYTKIKPIPETYISPTLPSVTPNISIGEPMDLISVKTILKTTWTTADAANHRIPRAGAEKYAKRAYYLENKLAASATTLVIELESTPKHVGRKTSQEMWRKKL